MLVGGPSCRLLQAAKPAFLDPEATRPIAMAAQHLDGASSSGRGEGGQAGEDAPLLKGKAAAGADFDVARLAPKIKTAGLQ